MADYFEEALGGKSPAELGGIRKRMKASIQSSSKNFSARDWDELHRIKSVTGGRPEDVAPVAAVAVVIALAFWARQIYVENEREKNKAELSRVALVLEEENAKKKEFGNIEDSVLMKKECPTYDFSDDIHMYHVYTGLNALDNARDHCDLIEAVNKKLPNTLPICLGVKRTQMRNCVLSQTKPPDGSNMLETASNGKMIINDSFAAYSGYETFRDDMRKAIYRYLYIFETYSYAPRGFYLMNIVLSDGNVILLDRFKKVNYSMKYFIDHVIAFSRTPNDFMRLISGAELDTGINASLLNLYKAWKGSKGL